MALWGVESASGVSLDVPPRASLPLPMGTYNGIRPFLSQHEPVKTTLQVETVFTQMVSLTLYSDPSCPMFVSVLSNSEFLKVDKWLSPPWDSPGADDKYSAYLLVVMSGLGDSSYQNQHEGYNVR
jgi:hypothetical protein